MNKTEKFRCYAADKNRKLLKRNSVSPTRTIKCISKIIMECFNCLVHVVYAI